MEKSDTKLIRRADNPLVENAQRLDFVVGLEGLEVSTKGL
jgi:hypothetical protein